MAPTAAAAPVLTALRDLQQRLGEVPRRQLREHLTPLAEGLVDCSPALARDAVDASISFCRSLYSLARSSEALLLSRATLAVATEAGEPLLQRRAATLCGLLAADSADLVGAVEYYIAALRLATAAEDRLATSAVWNNIGLAMGIGAHYELAARCYRRALSFVEDREEPLFVRYSSQTNLASSLFHVGAIEEGLVFARKALEEQTPQFHEQDPHAALLLQRNLVRLLLATGQVAEAEPHMAACVALAENMRTPRSLVAASTTRAIYEMALGRTDLALTRLEGALGRAREIPAALRETLTVVIQAEEAAGNFERALMRLHELSDHIYRTAIDRAREHVELAALLPRTGSRLERDLGQTEARLVSKLAAPEPPAEWDTLDRLAVSAVLRMDPSGWHGKRVGALVKALALVSGSDPLQALEMGFAAELHDIGMMSVPEGILSKSAPLNDAERRIVSRHVEAGAELLRDDRHPRIFMARDVAAYHHARWDGAGYPEGVAGKRIPLAARACAIAEAYDAMVCGIGARAPRSMDDALAELHRHAGAQFDPQLVACFDEMVREQTHDLGFELGASPGIREFHELVHSLQEDRGFV